MTWVYLTHDIGIGRARGANPAAALFHMVFLIALAGGGDYPLATLDIPLSLIAFNVNTWNNNQAYGEIILYYLFYQSKLILSAWNIKFTSLVYVMPTRYRTGLNLTNATICWPMTLYKNYNHPSTWNALIHGEVALCWTSFIGNMFKDFCYHSVDVSFGMIFLWKSISTAL